MFKQSVEQALKRNLVGFWPLNEAAGAVARTRSERVAFDMAVTGTVGASSTVGPSNILRSRSFGGGANYLSTSDNVIWTPQIGRPFTVSGWIYITSKASTRTLIAHNQPTGNDRCWVLCYNVTADRFQFVISQDGTSTTTSNAVDSALGSPSTNTWYYLFARWDGNKASIRVNMLAEASGAAITAVRNSAETLRIGHDGATGHVGNAAAVGIWDDYLPNAAGIYLYNNGAGRLIR